MEKKNKNGEIKWFKFYKIHIKGENISIIFCVSETNQAHFSFGSA